MCFYAAEAEWFATISDEKEIVLDKDRKCMECRAVMPAGSTVFYLHQQEHEECQGCDNLECKCDYEEPCFGEVYDYYCCLNCRKFLEAVEAAEIDAGCERSDSRPSYEGMMDEIREGRAGEALKYWRKAKKMYPELKANGYLARLWSMLFAK